MNVALPSESVTKQPQRLFIDLQALGIGQDVGVPAQQGCTRSTSDTVGGMGMFRQLLFDSFFFRLYGGGQRG